MRRLLLFLSLMCCLPTLAGADFVVVVGPESPVQMLDRRQVANIFLSKTNRHANGSRVQPVELSNNDLKSDFYRLISGKTLPQINSYWTTLIFTGKGKPPKHYAELEQIIRVLMEDPRAIAYLPADGIPEGLKIIYRPE